MPAPITFHNTTFACVRLALHHLLLSCRDSRFEAPGDVLYGGPGNDTFVFNFLNTGLAQIRDFAAGQDVIDFHQLLATAGYTGINPISDGWPNLLTDGNEGTDVVVDAHNGQPTQMVVDVSGVAPSLLHVGTSSWTPVV
jgi:hypothetical protein